MTQLEQLFNEDRAHFMHPSTHAHDHASGALPGKIVTGAKGIRIEDHQGKSYIDAFAGLYCVNIGYGRTEVADAIYEQAKKLAYYHTYVGHSTDTIIELSSRIIDWSPAGMKKVYYGMSGSDANETQIKIVWYYNNVLGRPNKKKIISRQRGYHGSGIVTGSLTGLPSFHQHFDLPIDRVKHTVCPHWYRQAPAGMSEAQFVAYCVEELEKLIAQEGADTIAAFIGEPVMGTGGIIAPPDGYWSAIQQVLKKHDILLISDEVVCGFGRLGSKMGAQHYGILPDLITVAKGLTSAYAPLSGVIVGERVWDVIEQGLAGTSARWATAGLIRGTRSARLRRSRTSKFSSARTSRRTRRDVGAYLRSTTARGVRPASARRRSASARACWPRSNSWPTRKAASLSTPR